MFAKCDLSLLSQVYIYVSFPGNQSYKELHILLIIVSIKTEK